jgi:hypothetical protein
MIVFGFCILTPKLAVSATPPSCDVNIHLPAIQVFAKTGDADVWHEYRSSKDVPDSGADDGIFAELWKGPDGSLLIRASEPGEDFWTYTDYCFASDGNLRGVKFEVRTAWGWAYRLEGSVAKDVVHKLSEQFFDTKTGKSIPRPTNADDVPDGLKPALYLQVKQLPFAKLIHARPKSESAPTPK